MPVALKPAQVWRIIISGKSPGRIYGIPGESSLSFTNRKTLLTGVNGILATMFLTRADYPVSTRSAGCVSSRGELTIMEFRYSKHVLEKLDRRNLLESLLEDVLQAPEQKIPLSDNITCYQSRVIDKYPYLLRIMVNTAVKPPVVITIYRSKNINKYWRTT